MTKFITQFFNKSKDGGPNSPVDGYFLIECKGLFSIALLKFNKGQREEFHTHAFNAYTWFLKGDLLEEDAGGTFYKYRRKLVPKLTKKEKNHRVIAKEDSWCFTLRGPWDMYWTEYNRNSNQTTVFTHGRNVVDVKEGV